MTMETHKGNHLIGLVYSFRDLVHFHHDKKHGIIPANTNEHKNKKIKIMLKQASKQTNLQNTSINTCVSVLDSMFFCNM